MVDILALPLISVLTVKFWCALFGIRDAAVVSVITLAALGEAIVRLAAARAERGRPATFCEERRVDLIAGILIGTGPWPIAQVIGGRVGAIVQPLVIPVWLRLAALTAIVIITACRVATSLGYLPPSERRRLIRELTGVPEFHIASLQVLTATPAKAG